MRDVHALIWPLTYECLEACSRLYIPEFDRSVIAAAGKRMAIRTEYNPPYPVGVAPQHLKALPAIDIPEANHLVFATAGKCTSVGTEGHRSNPAAMPL